MPMNRKRVLIWVGLGIGLLVVWLLIPPSPGVSRANAFRLRYGMSKPEVEAILGKPGNAFEGDKSLLRWADADLMSSVLVTFDGSGKLEYAEYAHGRLELLAFDDDTFFSRLRRRLGLWSPPRKQQP